MIVWWLIQKWIRRVWLALWGLDETALIENSPQLIASLKRGLRSARRGQLIPVDSIFDD